jgi:hypothetical protein
MFSCWPSACGNRRVRGYHLLLSLDGSALFFAAADAHLTSICVVVGRYPEHYWGLNRNIHKVIEDTKVFSNPT